MNKVSKIVVCALLCIGTKMSAMNNAKQAITDIFMNAYNSGQLVVKEFVPQPNGWPQIGYFIDTTNAKWAVNGLPGTPINYPLLQQLHTAIASVPGVKMFHGFPPSQTIAAILLAQKQVAYDYATFPQE